MVYGIRETARRGRVVVWRVIGRGATRAGGVEWRDVPLASSRRERRRLARQDWQCCSLLVASGSQSWTCIPGLYCIPGQVMVVRVK